MSNTMIDAVRSLPGLIGQLELLRPGGNHAEAIARVAWSVIAEPGDSVAGALISARGAVDALTHALDERSVMGVDDSQGELAENLPRWNSHARPRDVAEAIARAREVSAQLLLPGDELWPTGLDDLGDHAPYLLWVRGNAELLSVPSRVALIGARAATGGGEALTWKMASELAGDGLAVVGGLAYGIEGAAHRGALNANGATIAVLASGVDRPYPIGHRVLMDQIVENGAVVSELPCGATPTRWKFLARNRIISAITEATVVVEAGWRSGSLNAAGHASVLGRVLAAVPGPADLPQSQGTLRLLKEYAANPVMSAADVRALLPSLTITDAPAS